MNDIPQIGGNGGAGGAGGSTSLTGPGGGGGGGGGGNGGAGLIISAGPFTNNSVITGGNGGAGGEGGSVPFCPDPCSFTSPNPGSGGGGGIGGVGLVSTASGVTITNNGTIRGGNGGNGGFGGGNAPGEADGALSGFGGSGGIGVQFAASGATLINNGTIQGGNDGSTPLSLIQGAGRGVGISGSNLTIINSGTIAGGGLFGGGSPGNAIEFTGGVNSLTITGTSSITGNVVAQSGDIFALGGATAGNFMMSQLGSQYLNFGQFQKTGTSAWTLTNGPSATALPWTIVAGTLDIGATTQIAAAVNNSGSLIVGNGGSLTSTGIVNNGTLTTAGTISGGLTNSATVNAQGTINGALANNAGSFTVTGPLTANNSFTNASGATLAVGGNSFTGITTLTNNGLVSMAGGTLATTATNNNGMFNVAGNSTVNGSFSNAGTVNLQNNAVGDTLNVGGNYVGSPGSRILLDFSSQTAQADQVRITGSASGSTAVSVLNLTPLAPFTTGATIIQANSPIVPNTFTLVTAPFGTTTLALLPQNGGLQLAVGSIPSVAGLSSGIALTAAQTIAFQSSNVVFDHIWEVRNSLNNSTEPQAQGFADEALGYTAKRRVTDAFAAFKAPPTPVGPTVRPAVWVKAWGDYQDQNGSTVINFGGQTFPQDLGFRQRTGGVLAGADALIKNVTSANDALLLGALLGYTDSHVDLKASPTTQNFDGGSLGVYATYLRGNWFTDLMFKTDLLNVSINGGGINQKADLVNYAVTGNIGYKFDLPNKYYVEPTAGIEYVSSNFSGTTAFSPTTIALNDGEATRGRIGARVGTEFLVNGVRIEPSLLGYVYSIFSQTGNALVFSSTGITLPSDVGKVRGEIQAAVNFFNLTNGVSGFVKADTRFGDNLTAGGVRVGLRYQM
ncbi:autotransporter outer membrane beta-barrel domain-containing protein [Bradyrhizobium sp. JYMT SZCCT0428]|uniref:autotransporter outer membrane beta-barrel domain-containing protein n=1 Tax=Bradyrhizobium sp. JYMT SZCCT0428 TaxID=2807673 RepID=UPI001BA9E327|nr:autotransporter outer membrane beta-barrel domain-containing protein [Bradyrhizobium sp. JYMT SZCCT0428]MBR1155192.1 autotransporter outer membrane beta-barrel domain-containing protein [Bradyrhizobium sp. JYMT SZCCT0428]